MKPTARAPTAAVLAAGLLLLLGGCGTSPPLRYHALAAVPPAGSAAAASPTGDATAPPAGAAQVPPAPTTGAAQVPPAPTTGAVQVPPALPGAAMQTAPALAVGAVQIPPALDRAEVLREVAAGRFEVLDGDLWAAPLARLARQALAEDLAARLPPGRVVFPGAAGPAGAVALTVSILSFRVADGTATMLLSWDLRPPAPAAPAARRGGQLRLQAAAAGDNAAATARAFSELLGQLADRLAAESMRMP